MTERERLIELLDIIIQPGQKTLGDIADYLLANGVVVLPCRVGDIMYYIGKSTDLSALHKINHNSLCETETYKVDT